MSVYVDELTKWPHAWGPFKNGSCHLTADSLEELNAFAVGLGLKISWLQRHPVADHYDLTPSRRAKALAAGALFISAREQARRRRAGK